VAPMCPTGTASPYPCRGEALPRPPAPHGAAIQRGRHVPPDTQRRPAERPSPRSPGRSRPGSVPKPADPYGACTEPIDPGAWAPSQPPSGGLRTEPGASAPGVRGRPPPPWSSPHPGTDWHALPALAGRTGQAAPDPYKRGVHPPVAPQDPTGDAARHVVGARRGLARPRRMARQCIVADTSRPTRTADQPSARIHDRPAVNGRAQSPSRLEPAGPDGACTQPIDPRACTSSSPLQGACGLSPGLQPRAH